MAQLLTQARPYARAVFDVATQQKDVEYWIEFLKGAVHLISQEDVEQYLCHPKTSPDVAMAFFVDVFLAAMNEQQKNLLYLLIKQKHLLLLPNISALFMYYHEQRKGIVRVEVRSAFGLSSEQRQRLQSALAMHLSKDVELDCTECPTLIGGAIIRTPEWVLDASVIGRLEQLKKNLVG